MSSANSNANQETRGFRKTREGVVISDKMDKTVTVRRSEEHTSELQSH